MIDVDGAALALATDPVSTLPDLGFTLPPELSDDDFATFWGAIHAECADLGVDIVTGHTARYADCSFPWVGGATALAVGDHDEVIRPDGARPGVDLSSTSRGCSRFRSVLHHSRSQQCPRWQVT